VSIIVTIATIYLEVLESRKPLRTVKEPWKREESNRMSNTPREEGRVEIRNNCHGLGFLLGRPNTTSLPLRTYLPSHLRYITLSS
jgi:hypothetical protein